MTIYVVRVWRHSSFYISICGNDIDLWGAALWANAVTALTAARTRRIPAMVRCRHKWRWEVVGARVFNLSVTVNNLGRRRFIALLSKCFRRIRVLWPSYWSNWEDVRQSGRNSSKPHRMHAVRKASGPWQSYNWPFKLFSVARFSASSQFLRTCIFEHVRPQPL